MNRSNREPDSRTIFHVLSFEGPDHYSRAGGIATRVTGLSRALADRGFETHLWFVGNPDDRGHEDSGGVGLHRWCQWISRYHPSGVYDGEEGKVSDYTASLPLWLASREIVPAVRRGERPVVLAEEWQTAEAVIHLDWLLRREGVRDRVTMFWNANNTFGFDRIDWQRLARAATITTVSRFMKHSMWPLGVDALVIPNGLAREAFDPPDSRAVAEVREIFRGRMLLTKVARFDPDKRWLMAVRAVAAMKRAGFRPLLIARGGVERHGSEVLDEARRAGLAVIDRALGEPGVGGWSQVLESVNGADVVRLTTPLDGGTLRPLFRASDAVLANSGREPFGLVGLEAMAAGAVVCTGCTGEEYAVAGRNALVLQTNEPRELVGLLHALRADPDREGALRRAAKATSREYSWPEIIRRNLEPHVGLAEWQSAHEGAPE